MSSTVESSGRARRWVTGLALVVGAGACVVAVVAIALLEGVRGDLRAERARTDRLSAKVSGLESIRADLTSLMVDVDDLATDLESVSDLTAVIDDYLASADLASWADLDAVTAQLDSLSIYLTDVVNCLNDNLDYISRGERLAYCG